MCADCMAKEGSHSASSVTWDRPPSGMESLLLRDKFGSREGKFIYIECLFYFLSRSASEANYGLPKKKKGSLENQRLRVGFFWDRN